MIFRARLATLPEKGREHMWALIEYPARVRGRTSNRRTISIARALHTSSACRAGNLLGEPISAGGLQRATAACCPQIGPRPMLQLYGRVAHRCLLRSPCLRGCFCTCGDPAMSSYSYGSSLRWAYGGSPRRGEACQAQTQRSTWCDSFLEDESARCLVLLLLVVPSQSVLTDS